MSNAKQCSRWTEADRLSALARYAILDSDPEQSFDNIVQMVVMNLKVPIAAINLIAHNRQWFKAEIGLGVREMPLDESICATAMLEPDNMIVPDTREDPRFRCNSLITADPGLRFYAGELLRTPEGIPLGTLCALDTRPRPEGLSPDQRFMLKALAEQVMIQLELRRAILQREELLIAQHNAHALNRQILDSALDYAIISLDLQGKITSWNAGASKVLGWSEAEMLGQEADRLYTLEDVAEGIPHAERAVALREGCATDKRWHRRKNGERFWASGDLTRLKNEQGGIIGFVKVMSDGTLQKRVESDLHLLNLTLESKVAERTRERDRLWRNSRDIFVVLSADGIVQAVNPAWTTILGHSRADFIGRTFTIFLHPDDLAQSMAALEHAAVRPMAHFENRYRHKDGTYRWLAWTAASEDGLIYANARDINAEKKQAAQIAVANDARMQLALDAGQMGAWQWHVETDEVLWMHGTARVHGQPQSSSQRLNVDRYVEYVHADDRAELLQKMQQAVAQRDDLQVEYRVVWPDRSVHWLQGSGKLLFSEAGEPTEMVGIVADITQRKVTEQNLRFLAQASAELAGLYDPKVTLDKLAQLAVPTFADWCVVDLLQEEGTVLDRVAVANVNPEKVRQVRELQRRFPSDKNAPHGAWNIVRTRKAELLGNITEKSLAHSIKNEELRSAFQALGLRSYIAAPLMAHGQVLGVITFILAESGRLYNARDLTLAEDLARRAGVAIENANLVQALKQSDRGKDVFLATLAHELRNPLAAITNALSITRLAADDRKRVEQATNIIHGQVGHLTRLVDDLMDIARIATGKIELRKETTSLAQILNSAIESSRVHIEALQHQLSVRLPGEPTTVQADPVRLTQVFSNLLDNAAKYTRAGGRIGVSLECTASEFAVRVSDTGVGIPGDMLKKIFTIFSQVDHPLERNGGGLGIGLSLVEGLIKLHGGRVEAHSAGPNAGSEFVVYLPRPVPEAGRHHMNTDFVPESVMQGFDSRRILIVDDNVDAASTLAEILQILGNDVVGVVHDGLTAVDEIARITPDVVLLDIGLPKIDGYEVARRVRARQDKQQVMLVALTGWGHEKDRERAHQAGFDHHLVKPVKLEQLQEILMRG